MDWQNTPSNLPPLFAHAHCAAVTSFQAKMSLSNPSREYLRGNFTKPQLQAQCRNLGIMRGLHVTKEELIQLILDKHQTTTDAQGIPDVEDVSEDTSVAQMQHLLSEIREIKEKLAVKDVEIDYLYSKLRAANDTINDL